MGVLLAREATASVRAGDIVGDHVTGNRQAPTQIEEAYRKALVLVGKEPGLPAHFTDGAYAITQHFHYGPYGAVDAPDFNFDPLNSITPRTTSRPAPDPP